MIALTPFQNSGCISQTNWPNPCANWPVATSPGQPLSWEGVTLEKTRFPRKPGFLIRLPPSLLLRERVQVPGGADVEGVVGDGGGGGDAFAEGGVAGDDFGGADAGFQDGHGAVGQRGEVDVAVGGDGGSVVASLRGDALLQVDFLAGLGVVGGDHAAV